MSKITNEEISALVANQIKEMELNGIFSEDTLEQIQEKVSSRMGTEDIVLEEEVSPESPEEIEASSVSTPEADIESVSVDDKPVVTNYEVEMPDFLNKIEPAKFVIFDMNEVSLGGEQLSNKPLKSSSKKNKKGQPFLHHVAL